jgi:hypothetical protein
MRTFKQYLKREEHFEKWENMLHHMAEEELVACKIFSVHLLDGGPPTVIEFRTDCADRPRDLGYQRDLSEKLTLRLKKHILQGLGRIEAKVVHVNYDKR